MLKRQTADDFRDMKLSSLSLRGWRDISAQGKRTYNRKEKMATYHFKRSVLSVWKFDCHFWGQLKSTCLFSFSKLLSKCFQKWRSLQEERKQKYSRYLQELRSDAESEISVDEGMVFYSNGIDSEISED